jgi:hypothetical protein
MGAAGATRLFRKRQHIDQFEQKYRKWWGSERERINTFGLRDVGENPKVRDIFVHLRVMADTLERSERHPLVLKASGESKPIWDFLNHISISPERNVALVLLGGAGFGKTTLMQHVALSFVFDDYRKHGMQTFYVPLLLYIREHAATILRDRPSLGIFVETYFNTSHNLAPPAGWFEEQLRAGRCIVLLDGMDEVPTPEDRQAVAAWIDSQISTYNQALFVITSRPGGYKEAPLAHDRKSILSMQSFTHDQRREFLEKWYEAHYGRFIIVPSSGARKRDEARVRAENKEKADRKAEEVLAELARKPVLNEFAGNPLLLTMIAIAAQTEGGLPNSRLKLYDEIYEVLLYRRADKKGVEETLTRFQKDRLLRALAMFVMRRETSLEVSTSEAMQTWHAHITRFQVPENSLPMLQSTTNLVIPVADERWIFAHKTFMEYIAAREIQERGVDAPWRDLVEKTWWHETLRFYAEMVGEATDIVDACLESQTMPALVLAAHFIDTKATVQIDAALRERVKNLLLTALESDDPERFRLAADVQLARRCARLHRIDEQREIDLHYITCVEYQVFLDEKRVEGEYYQPDHWTDYRFVPGQARKPIAGVRSKDAQRFCAWLTARQGDNAWYRLPTLEEARASPAQEHQEVLSAWCQSEPDSVQLDNSSVFALDLALDLARARDLDLNRALDCVIDLTPYRDHAYVRNLDLDLDRTLARARLLAHDLDFDRTLAHGLDRTLARARLLALDLAFARDPILARDLRRLRDLDFDTPLALALARDKIHIHDLARLLALEQSDAMQQRHKLREYMAALFIYAWMVYEISEREGSPKKWWWQRWRARRPKVDYTSEKEAVLVAYLWLEIVMQRERGDLHAWESIRIVRERRDM